MYKPTVRATIIDVGEKVNLWFHLEDGPPDTMTESFIVGMYDSVAQAEEALRGITGLDIVQQPTMVR